MGIWKMLQVPFLSLKSFLSILILKVKRTSMSFKSWFGLWRMLEGPDFCLLSPSWFWYGNWFLIYPCYKFWLSILILKVQRKFMSFKSWFGLWRTVEAPNWGLWSSSWFTYGLWYPHVPNFGSSWWSRKKTSMSFKSWCAVFEDTEGSWLGFRTFDLHLDIVPGLWYTHV